MLTRIGYDECNESEDDTRSLFENAYFVGRDMISLTIKMFEISGSHGGEREDFSQPSGVQRSVVSLK
jgi:hypothetical protein